MFLELYNQSLKKNIFFQLFFYTILFFILFLLIIITNIQNNSCCSYKKSNELPKYCEDLKSSVKCKEKKFNKYVLKNEFLKISGQNIQTKFIYNLISTYHYNSYKYNKYPLCLIFSGNLIIYLLRWTWNGKKLYINNYRKFN